MFQCVEYSINCPLFQTSQYLRKQTLLLSVYVLFFRKMKPEMFYY